MRCAIEAVWFGTCYVRMRKTTQRRRCESACVCTRIIVTFLAPFVCEGLDVRLERQAEHDVLPEHQKKCQVVCSDLCGVY